jgi:hypothetical protein
LSSTVANGTTTPVITLNVPTASATNRGALSSADWTSFNGKQAALSGTGIVKSTAGVISYLTDPLPIANGGTGSSTQNFVDLTTTQTIGGFKTFSNTIKLDNGTSNAFLFESGTTGFYTTLKAAAGLGADIIVTLPSATGTLALTSDLSGYLPLTGGTLTGALSGTSATFSSTVGIGTATSPAAELQVGKASDVVIAMSNSSSVTTGNRGGIAWYNSNTSTVANIRAVAVTDNVGTELQFYTRPVAGSLTQVMTITSAGNVGIGTTSPTEKLDVRGNIYTNGTNTNLYLDNGGAGGAALKIGVIGTTETYISSLDSDPLWFGTSNTERMRITSGGNVLIGTTTDAGYKLDVNGTGRFSSSISNDYVLSAWNTNTTAGTSFGAFIRGGTNASDFALNVNNAANTVTLFQVKGDGTATFSSSVTAAGFVFIGLDGTYGPTYSGISFQGTSAGVNGENRIFAGRAGADGLFLASATSRGIYFRAGGSISDHLIISSTGTVTIANLAGSGSRAVLADANGLLSAPISDISVKQNIVPIGYGLNEIMKMNPVWFDFVDEYKNFGEGRQNGNIAQEIAEIIPEAVFTTPSTGKMGINYDQLHAVYIKAIKELKAEIDILKNN